MTREWMITSYQNHIWSCIYEDSKLMELEILNDIQKSSDEHERNFHSNHTEPAPDKQYGSVTLGNIYVGRVQNVVKNLNAAFIEIQNGVPCYYSLDDNTPVYLNPKNTDRIVIGDEVLVQVSKEAIKQKAPVVSSTLSLTGTYVVVETGKHTVGISKRLSKDENLISLKQIIQKELPEGYSVILRTNAAGADPETVLSEYHTLLSKLQDIIDTAKYKKVFSCLYQEAGELKRILQNIQNPNLIKITTDLPEIYDALTLLLKDSIPESDPAILKLYKQELQPLYAVYKLDRDYKEAVEKKVWLRSGAYLVIEQTEAMVVIDVNTGKAVNKKAKEEHFLKVNMEAMTEIVRQLRLRNLSGIIMIDFIDMEEASSRASLIEHIKAEIKKDRIPTNYIEMTKLNLVELTRKKVQRSLMEQLKKEK